MKRTIVSVFIFVLLICKISYSQNLTTLPQVSPMDKNNFNQTDDKVLSPYFLVQSMDGVENFPLLSTEADIAIAGVIADVTIKQTYVNRGKKTIEAIYIFPASTKSAVYEMTMTIGKRVIKATVDKREKAKESYEQAKREGKTATLLEQQRPNVFQMNIANILPGDTIKVELKYTEIIIPNEGVYTFVYPTVVGPRYSNKSKKVADDSDKFIETPYLKEGEEPTYDFKLSLSLSSPVPISEITSQSHKINISEMNDNFYEIKLDTTEFKKGNKDFILNYSLKGKKIQTGLLLSQSNKENFYLLMLQPPQRVKKDELPPREYIFVVDISGSMYGFPLNASKALIRKILCELKTYEKFNVIFFSGGSQVLFPDLEYATPQNIQKADSMLALARAGGGTELLEALQKAYSFKENLEFSRTVVLITDGYVSCEKEAFDLIRKNLGNTNLFTFGIGSSVNRFLIEGLARIGKGESFVVTNEMEAAPSAARFFEYITNPILTNTTIEYKGFLVYDQEPINIPDVFADRPIIIIGKWGGNADGEIIVKGKANNQNLSVTVPVKLFATIDESNALKYLWAREKLARLSDYASISDEKEFADEITQIGLDYNLLTAYTSFIAIDEENRRISDEYVRVNQALPLPEGVSEFAVGSSFIGGFSQMRSSPTHYRMSSDVDALNYQDIDESIPYDTPPSYNPKELQELVNYPEFAKLAGLEGRVMVKAFIDEFGNVTKYEIGGSDNVLFNFSAVEAVRKLKFKPAIKNGQPEPAWVTLPITYKLGSKTHHKRVLAKNLNGIEFVDLTIGKGKPIYDGDKVKMHYLAYVDDTQELLFNSYNSGKPLEFKLGSSEIIKGINEGIDGMRYGGKRLIIIPHNKRLIGQPQFNLIRDKHLILIIEVVN